MTEPPASDPATTGASAREAWDALCALCEEPLNGPEVRARRRRLLALLAGRGSGTVDAA